MIKSYRIVSLIAATLCCAPLISGQTPTDSPVYQPATDAEVVTLDKPTRRIALPEAEQDPQGPDRSFPLDPAWQVERITIDAGGQNAFLLVYESDQNDPSKPPYKTKGSIRRISLDTGQEIARYPIPEPFASIRFPAAWGTGNAGLNVSVDGKSLTTAYAPTQLLIRNEVDNKYARSMTFFRWDTRSQGLTNEHVVPYAGCRSKMLTSADQMLVWRSGENKRQVECWNTEDLSTTPLIEFTSCPTDNPKRDGCITICRDCITYDPANGLLDVMLHWRGRRLPAEQQPVWLNWYQQYDTKTGQPTGPGIRFRNVHTIEPKALCGQHLLLIEQDATSLDHRITAHVWNVRSREHVAAIDVTPNSKPHFYRADLTPDGSAVIYKMKRLDLDTFEWTKARSYEHNSSGTAFTPDGRRAILVYHPVKTNGDTSSSLWVYDLK